MIDSVLAAASARLSVETADLKIDSKYRSAAAFGRLCVETAIKRQVVSMTKRSRVLKQDVEQVALILCGGNHLRVSIYFVFTKNK